MRLLQITSAVLSAASLAAAVPAQWADDMQAYYKAVGEDYNRMLAVRGFPTGGPQCDLSKAQQPVSTSSLPAPDGLKLVHVAVGRGTQNYTCQNIADDTAPLQTGAVAVLWDASCLAANRSPVLDLLPQLTLQYVNLKSPLFATTALAQFSNLMVSGHHYFDSHVVPFFDLTSQPRDIGSCYGAKVATVPAPPTATKGKDGKGFGSVGWLRLDAKKDYLESVNIKTVYRLNTAGGNPPPTCGDRTDKSTTDIFVDYAAEYWFYE